MLILYYAPKANHSGINSDWLYGMDLIWDLICIPELHFRRLEGFSRAGMSHLFRDSDCLLRPTRHDGYSYCVQEALFYGLPVLHTYPIPGVILIKPEIKDIEEKLCNLQSEL